MRTKLAIIALLFSATGFATSKSVDLGGLVLSVSHAPTAKIFHILDQLSQWSVYTQKEYERWAEKTQLLDQQDRELLKQHAEMRKKHGSGHGFANGERDILLHFAPKLQPLLRQRQSAIVVLEQQLVAEQARIAPLVVQLVHFAEVKDPPTVTAFLVANAKSTTAGPKRTGDA